MKRLLVIAVVMLISLGYSNSALASENKEISSEVVYDILVDRFNNGERVHNEQIDLEDPFSYHGGDLQGIIDKLGHFEELGYTTLVLSPIMENAPNGYHGYWIEDFYKVDDHYGTMKDLQQLVKEAHERDIKIVLEFVTNYTASTHPMTEDSEKSDWFKDTSGVSNGRWLDETAVLDQSNPDVQNFLTDVANYWIEKANIDGYRFHAADQANKTFLNNLTEHISDNYPEVYLLGDRLNNEGDTEDLTGDTAIQAADNHALYSSMTDVFSNVGTPLNLLHETWENSGKPYDGLNYLDNQDTKRFTQRLIENEQNPLTTWKLALTYLYTAPGTPVIFQGSEIPMGGAFPASQQLVQWNSADEDLDKFINRIASLRSEFLALQHGDYELLGSSGAMSVFRRSFEDESIYVAINNDTQSQAVTVESVSSDTLLKGLLGDNLVRDNEDGEFKIGLARETAEIFVVEDDTGLNWIVIGPVAGVMIAFVVGVIYLSWKQKKREADA